MGLLNDAELHLDTGIAALPLRPSIQTVRVSLTQHSAVELKSGNLVFRQLRAKKLFVPSIFTPRTKYTDLLMTSLYSRVLTTIQFK